MRFSSLAITLAIVLSAPGALAQYTAGPATAPYASIQGVPGAAQLLIVSGCDDCVETVPLSFAFPWFGTNLTSVNVCSNGAIIMDGNTASLCCSAWALDNGQIGGTPVYAQQVDRISVAQEDLDPAGMNVWMLDTGVSIIISFEAVSWFPGPTTGSVEAQVELFANGVIEVRFGTIVTAGNNFVCGTSSDQGGTVVFTSAGSVLPEFNAVGQTTGGIAPQNTGVLFQPSAGGNAWQTNSAVSSLDIDGLQGNAYVGAQTTTCVGGAHTLNSASTPGTPTDIAVVFAATGPTMVLSSPNNVVNIDVLHPTMFSFNGGVPNFAGLLNLVPHPGAFSFPVPTGGPFVGSAQQLAIDPSNADGYALSQASQLDVTVGGPGVAGPTADDTPIQISLTGTGFCSGAGSIAFYGTTYTQMWISPNGRVAFSASPGIDYTPTLAEALSQTEIVGYWTDLSPNAGGNVTVTNTATSGYRIDWSGVPYFATPAPLNSFAIEFDPSGVVTLDGLTGIGPQPGVAIGGDDAFLGMSPGGPGGATDDGPTTFGAGLAGGPVNAASMLYDFYSASTGAGLSGSLLPGTLNRIDFVPSGLNNYLWIGL
ncbi:MAG: hypothetical protein HRU14_00105 [Planctomycetes bacterium]|nr:hypothetical protein [Planctomycetota bacterium]